MRMITDKRWRVDPWSELERLLTRGLSDWPFGLSTAAEGLSRPMPLNIYETATSRIVEVELPGVSKDDVKLEQERDLLRIRVKRIEGEGDNRAESEVSRMVRMGDDIESDSIKAKLEDGILTVTLSKSERARRQAIAIE